MIERAIGGIGQVIKFTLTADIVSYANIMPDNTKNRSEAAAIYTEIYSEVISRAESQDFAGYDPFDGLESRLFKAIPLLSGSSLARIAWLQAVKRFPVNIRPLLKVPSGVNPKGLALFVLSELSLIRSGRRNAGLIYRLLDSLDELALYRKTNDGRTTRSFGYNFDWQSRAFFAPKGTPTIVPTAFAAKAYLEAFEMFGDIRHLNAAEEVSLFILNDLRRPVEAESTICFSYTPADNSIILNASLLAAEVLSRTGKLANKAVYHETALRAASFVLENQTKEGSWPYGTRLRHKWVDNFHTAFMISSLKAIYDNSLDYSGDPDSHSFSDAISRGVDYWISNFFLDSGAPKYFHNRTYPIDIHSSAAAIVTLCEIAEIREDAVSLACKIANWTLENMYEGAGRFSYQINKFYKTKTEFIRWGQAWMAFALARLIETLGSKSE